MYKIDFNWFISCVRHNESTVYFVSIIKSTKYIIIINWIQYNHVLVQYILTNLYYAYYHKW